jgi:hypothetical protein
MENAYQPELWHDFFVVLGSSSAALIGLLFISAKSLTIRFCASGHLTIRFFS